MSDLILPSARLGVVHCVGEIMTADFRNGVSVFVRDDRVVQRIMKDGQITEEVAFGETQMVQMAEFFRRGADMIQKQGGSGLPASRIVPGQAAE